MRQLIVAATVLVALTLVAVPTASAQLPGFGGSPFGTPFGGLPGFGFGMMGAPGGFGMPGSMGMMGGPGGLGMPGSPGSMGMMGAPGGFGMPGAMGGFGGGMPWNGAQGGGPGALANGAPGCAGNPGNPASAPGGSAPGSYANCVPASASANPNAGCTGPFTAALTPTGQGSAAVSGTLSFTQPSNGAFTVTGTLTGVSDGQTITLTIPVTSGTPEAATAVVPAGSTSISFGGTMSGIPANGGTVTVTETTQTGTLAQGAISGSCTGGTLANAPQQLCTDSQGNRVLVPSGSATSSYTNCAAAPASPAQSYAGSLAGTGGYGTPPAAQTGTGGYGAPPAAQAAPATQAAPAAQAAPATQPAAR